MSQPELCWQACFPTNTETIRVNVGKTITHHLFGNDFNNLLFMDIYGDDWGNGLLLFDPHCIHRELPIDVP